MSHHPLRTAPEGLPLSLRTALGEGPLLIGAIRGREAISELFLYRLELIADPQTAIPFEKILGGPATVTLRGNGVSRHISGMVSRFSQSDTDDDCAHYRIELSPHLWLLTKSLQSRVFQQMSVPDILKQVFEGLKVSWKLNRKYPALNYCVQYNETDFRFASRIMEAAGIYYYFQHELDHEVLVLSDQSQSYPDLPGKNQLIYNRVKDAPKESFVTRWDKSQTVGVGTYTVGDYHFEVSQNRLEASAALAESATIGTVRHPLNGAQTLPLKVSEFPGGYASRYDGVDPNGDVVASDLTPLFDEPRKTATLWMDREACACLEVGGESTYYHLQSGYQFEFQRHPNADGSYLLTSVDLDAEMSGFYSGSEITFTYKNRFRCLPSALAYRPACGTTKPSISGPQTAVVMGLGPNEPHVDRFGRVKVRFRWDRQGRNDARSSCWVRVAQLWAGSGWGAAFWPRPGQEVVVAFEDGDPDRPLVTGSVYNDKETPPFPLPAQASIVGFKSQVSDGDATQFHGFVIDDSSTKPAVHVRSGKDALVEAKESLVFTGNEIDIAALTSTVSVGDTQINVTGWDMPAFPTEWPWQEFGPTFDWAKALVMGGHRWDLVRGTHSQLTLPKVSQVSIGSHSQLVTNPINATGSFAKLLLGAAGWSGFKEIVYTNRTGICSSYRIDCQAGYKLDAIGPNASITLGNRLQSPLAAAEFALGCMALSSQNELLMDALEVCDLALGLAGTLLPKSAGKLAQAAAATDISDATTVLLGQIASAANYFTMLSGHASKMSSYALSFAIPSNVYHNHSVQGIYALQANGVEMIARNTNVAIIGLTGVPILIDSADQMVTLASGPTMVNASGIAKTVTLAAGSNSAVEVSLTEASISVGVYEITVSADSIKISNGGTTTVTLNSDGINLEVDSNSISLTSSAITITGAQVNITATSSVKITAPEVSVTQG